MRTLRATRIAEYNRIHTVVVHPDQRCYIYVKTQTKRILDVLAHAALDSHAHHDFMRCDFHLDHVHLVHALPHWMPPGPQRRQAGRAHRRVAHAAAPRQHAEVQPTGRARLARRALARSDIARQPELIAALVLPRSYSILVVLVMRVVPLLDLLGVSFSISCLPFPVQLSFPGLLGLPRFFSLF
jgi:hypothetical protein